MICYMRKNSSYNRLCNYNQGDVCGKPVVVCPSGKVMRFCPGSRTPICVYEGTNWMTSCESHRTGLCPQGQDLHVCPDGNHVCAYPGTNWEQTCSSSPY